MTSSNNNTGHRNKCGVKVGVIASAHGIRGEVNIRSFSEPPDAIFSYGALTDETYVRTYVLTRRGGKDKTLIASIDGITDRNAAELLKGTELFVAASALPKKKSNQWYAHELIGIEARLPDGRVYGRVVQLYNFGAGDIIEIELANGKTEMLPFAPPFVGEVDADKGYIIVFPPDYVEGKE